MQFIYVTHYTPTNQPPTALNRSSLGSSFCDNVCYHSHTALHWLKLILQNLCKGVKSIGKFQLQNGSWLLFYNLKLMTILKGFVVMHSNFSGSAMILKPNFSLKYIKESLFPRGRCCWRYNSDEIHVLSSYLYSCFLPRFYRTSQFSSAAVQVS